MEMRSRLSASLLEDGLEARAALATGNARRANENKASETIDTKLAIKSVKLAPLIGYSDQREVSAARVLGSRDKRAAGRVAAPAGSGAFIATLTS